MGQKFRNWSVYSDGKKHGNAFKATLELMSGNETYVGDAGRLGTSTGKRTSKLSLSEYVPLGGKPEQDALYQAWLSGDDINITCAIIGGKTYALADATVMSIKFDTDMAKGTATMDIEIEGGVPDRAG